MTAAITSKQTTLHTIKLFNFLTFEGADSQILTRLFGYYGGYPNDISLS